MKSVFKSLRSTQATPLVALFAVVVTVLAGIVVYQQFFSSGKIEIGPFLMWLAITIPAGIFGSIFLQVRAAERQKRVEQKVQERIVEIETESRISRDPRRSSKPRFDNDNPLPDKDPFENL